jgi:two-component sensor histidine kinase
MPEPIPANDVGTTLAMAVVSASQAPLLLLDERLVVRAASQTFYLTYGVAPSIVGRPITEMDGETWNLPRLRSLLKAVLSGGGEVDGYDLDLVRPGHAPMRLRLNCDRLDYGDGASIRLLLTVSDTTDALAAERARSDLLREKDILLQEVQHRVANSLQIIASVLLQNARKVGSPESRQHLTDAHQRVMSVAAVQKQLAASRLGDVILKPYFTQLCESLGASMIADHDQLRIEVQGDGSATSAEISVSLGLIVTELVINALKHAFPGGRKGVISVDYHSYFEGWALSVSDDGVGMPGADDLPARAGLGTSIVNALATQLSATVEVVDLKPGTGVKVVHAESGAEAIGQPRGEDVAAV